MGFLIIIIVLVVLWALQKRASDETGFDARGSKSG